MASNLTFFVLPLGFSKKKGQRRVIKIKKKRKKQSVKALGEEIIPERTQL